MLYRHKVTGQLKEVSEHQAWLYDSPSWEVYQPKQVETILSDKQLDDIVFTLGGSTKTTKEKKIESIKVEDTTTNKDFTDNII